MVLGFHCGGDCVHMSLSLVPQVRDGGKTGGGLVGDLDSVFALITAITESLLTRTTCAPEPIKSQVAR